MNKEEDECKKAGYSVSSSEVENLECTVTIPPGQIIPPEVFECKIVRITRYMTPPLRAAHTCFANWKPGRIFFEVVVLDEDTDTKYAYLSDTK